MIVLLLQNILQAKNVLLSAKCVTIKKNKTKTTFFQIIVQF